MAGGKKSTCRQLSDLLAAYGSGILYGRAPIDYATCVGLLLNADRRWRREAAAMAEGVVAGQSARDLDRGWADALCLFEEMVDLLAYQINAERQTARVRARLGFPEP